MQLTTFFFNRDKIKDWVTDNTDLVAAAKVRGRSLTK